MMTRRSAAQEGDGRGIPHRRTGKDGAKMATAAGTRCNVLLIMSDQHSKYHIGCYGDPVVRTPNLDALAREGMRFTSAYCPSPVCITSRPAFMTGRYPSITHVWHSGIPTWAHALGAAGYETAMIGRMDFRGPDMRRGFEKRPVGEYWAHPGATPPPLGHVGGDGQGRSGVERAGTGRTAFQAHDDIVADGALAYLEEKERDPGDRPFAAVVGFILPHCPFVAPKELFEYYYERVDVPQQTPEERRREPLAIQRFKKIRSIYDPLPAERIRVARAAYFGLCECVDRHTGRILQVLEESGLDRNTLVIYTTDHGEMAGEHGCWWKSNFYEGSVGVPLIARLPGVVPAGTVKDTICNLMDLGPTLVEMAGADPMPAVDGRSIWPILSGGDDPGRPDETFSEHSHMIDGIPSRMIRRGPWKLYKYHDTTPPVLYNLEEDPGEMEDLGSDLRYEGVRSELLDRLYADWDPERVIRENMEVHRDMALIVRWGEAVRPGHEDTFPVPEGANQVTFL